MLFNKPVTFAVVTLPATPPALFPQALTDCNPVITLSLCEILPVSNAPYFQYDNLFKYPALDSAI